MKKTVVFVFAIALFFVIFSSFSRKNTSSDFTFLAMDLYNAFSSENESEFYTSIEKLKNEISYTNAKTTDKYRLRELLNYVEKGCYNTVAENIRADSVSIFGSCRTVSEGEFYGEINRIYNKYLAESEREFSEKAGFGERFSNYPENKFFHPLGASGVPDAFSSAASRIREKSPFFSAVVCKGFGEKYKVSPDGTVWLYGENCVFSLSEELDPRLLVVQKKGASDGLRLHSFKNKNVFSRREIICDGKIIKIKDLPESFITAENDDFSGFVTYDFSSYNFPRGNAASFGRN